MAAKITIRGGKKDSSAKQQATRRAKAGDRSNGGNLWTEEEVSLHQTRSALSSSERH